jgi:outer membrane protein
MNTKSTTMKQAVSLTALALFAAGAQAQSAGDITIRIGATSVRPQVESGDLSRPSLPGTKLNVGPATQVSGGITYQLTDRITLDLPLGPAFKHELFGAGAIEGVGKVGESNALPVTVLVQWRMAEPGAKFQPYVGIGPTYARIGASESTPTLTAITGGLPSKPTTLTMESGWGFTVQLGAAIPIAGRWSLDVAYMKAFLTSKGVTSTGQTIDLKLNPDVMSASLVYRF